MKPTSLLKHRMQGSIAIMVGLAIAVMIAFLGVVIDLGHMYTIKTELSNAADACALSAAQELTGDSNSLTRAENAAKVVTQKNLSDFQKTAVTFVTSQSDPANSTLTFSDQLTGTYHDASYFTGGQAALIPNMRYAKCLLPKTGIIPWFMQAVGFGDQTVASHAIASLKGSYTNCAIPVALNKQPTPFTCAHGGTPDPQYGFCVGEWYGSRLTTGGGNDSFSGNFNLIDFSTKAGGADEVKDLLTGGGQCDLTTGLPSTQTGTQGGALEKAWNTRFGLYQGATYNTSSAKPDATGFTYTPATWPSMFNAFSGSDAGAPNNINYLSANASDLDYQGDDITLLKNVCKTQPCSTNIPKLIRRLVLMPITDPPAGTGIILDFACVLLLQPVDGTSDPTYVEYIGKANAPGSPCTPSPGSPGGNGPLVPTLVR